MILDQYGRQKVSLGSSGDGWPFSHIISVSSSNPKANYPTIQAAINAAAAGDTILIDSETWTVAVGITVNKAVTLMCLDEIGALVQTATNDEDVIELAAVGAKLVNINILNGGGGSIASGVKVSANGCAIEKCIITANGGATNNMAIYHSAGTELEIHNCQLYESGGVSVGAGYYSSAGVSAKIFGGLLDGSIRDIVNAGTLQLNNLPLLMTANAITNTGTISGQYADASGNINFVGTSVINGLDKAKVSKLRESDDGADALTADASGNLTTEGHLTLPAGKDIFINTDGLGLGARLVWPFAITDHFTSGSIPTGYAWLAAGNIDGVAAAAPATVNYVYDSSWLYALAGVAQTNFLYKSATNDPIGKQIFATVSPGATGSVGVRLDKNSDNDWYEFWLSEQGTGACRWRFKYRVSPAAPVLVSGTVDLPNNIPYCISLLLYNAGATQLGIAYIFNLAAGNPCFQVNSPGEAKWGSTTHRSGLTNKAAQLAGLCDVFYNQFA